MDNKNQEKIEKLSQQQLIDSILERNKIEHEALVKATKKSIDNPEIDISKEKNKIMDKNLKKIETENNKKIDDLQHKILEEEVEIELQRWNEEERIQAEKRRKETERILKEIDQARKNRSRMEKRETERLRRKQQEKDKKKSNFLEQIKELTRTEQKNKNKNKDENSSIFYKPTYSTMILDKTKYEPENKTSTQNINDKVEKKKKINFKMFEVIQRYVSTMEFYERNKQILQAPRTTTKKSTKKENARRKSFVECLISAVDHKKAMENAKKKENERQPTIRPRIIG